MDLKYNNPGSQDIEPARRVYKTVSDRIELGEVTFVGISAKSETVTIATTEGIPSYLTDNHLFNLLSKS